MVAINGYQVGSDCFPNNERILKTSNWNYEQKVFNIEFKYSTDIDISMLIMCKKFLDDNFNNPEVTLIMKYVPYSRMDRNIKGYMFSLKYFCQLINDLKFNEVVVLDPHSNVTSGLLERCREIDINNLIRNIYYERKFNYVLYPDNGAYKRYSEILDVPNEVICFYGNKKRDLNTGEILQYELVDCPNIEGEDVLIVDDLCAGGLTFYNAAKALKERGVRNVFLYVSHCENTIYQGKLLKSGLIERIYTTDSILGDWSDDLLCDMTTYLGR